MKMFVYKLKKMFNRYQDRKLKGRKIYNANFNAGFSIIELMVSFAVLTVGLAAGINLIGQGLKSSSYSKNQSIASYLAVEGIELVKNKRDENFLKNVNWIQDLQNNCVTADPCTIDPINLINGINQCPIISGDPVCPPLKYDTTVNLYNYSTGPTTIFTRKIIISNSAAFGGNDREIISEVSWIDRFGPHTYTLKNHIFKWR